MRRSAVLVLIVITAMSLFSANSEATTPQQPDASIRRGVTGDYKGEGDHNTTGVGQRARARVKAGNSVMFQMKYENTSDRAPDTYFIHGCAGSRKFKVTYFSEGGNVTEDVVEGDYIPPGVGTEQTRDDFFIKIKAKAKADPGNVKNCGVTVTSKGTPDNADAVIARVKVKD
ncbi:MAG: hypothetical protein WD276_00180 [Actinomycetota bacterium]